MGTHIRSIGLIVAALCLALGTLAWAEAPAAEVESGAGQAIEIAQAAGEVEISCEAKKDLGVCGNHTGTAYYYDDRRPEVWVTLGSRVGLRVQARVQFVRDDEVVAEGTVTTVRDVDCIVYPDKDVVAGAIMLGDSVHVIKNGTRAQADAAIAREKRGHMLLTLLVSGGMAYLISL
ncbi:MAG: hypothetical protein JSV79_01270 [Armatimonadota bacterium]|nr:MAG: hypothetical protein JSV79_01270 [Armatimonadota bacterium]